MKEEPLDDLSELNYDQIKQLDDSGSNRETAESMQIDTLSESLNSDQGYASAWTTEVLPPSVDDQSANVASPNSQIRTGSEMSKSIVKPIPTTHKKDKNRSYVELITQAINSSPEKLMTLSEIYDWMIANIPAFKDQPYTRTSGWKNSVRHTLSRQSIFKRVKKDGLEKPSWWTIDSIEQSKHKCDNTRNQASPNLDGQQNTVGVVGSSHSSHSSGSDTTEQAPETVTTSNSKTGHPPYIDLITKAINSSPDKLMTLSGIYDWMVANVPAFREQRRSSNTSGWKNSVRHCLSLHRRFKRVKRNGLDKPSWWTVDVSEGCKRHCNKKSNQTSRNLDNQKAIVGSSISYSSSSNNEPVVKPATGTNIKSGHPSIYVELITQAINSSPEKRMTVGDIYDWMVANVQALKDQGDAHYSASWKKSVRRDLARCNRFKRVKRIAMDNASWWTVDLTDDTKQKYKRNRPIKRTSARADTIAAIIASNSGVAQEMDDEMEFQNVKVENE